MTTSIHDYKYSKNYQNSTLFIALIRVKLPVKISNDMSSFTIELGAVIHLRMGGNCLRFIRQRSTVRKLLLRKRLDGTLKFSLLNNSNRGRL